MLRAPWKPIRYWLMSFLYQRFISIWRRWYWISLLLIVATVGFTWTGLTIDYAQESIAQNESIKQTDKDNQANSAATGNASNSGTTNRPTNNRDFPKTPAYDNHLNRFYQSLKTLVLASPAIDKGLTNNWNLEIGRWLGVIFFFGGVMSVVSQLFTQSALSFFVFCFARRHIVLIGLGPPDSHDNALVEKLRAQWKSVVIIENDPRHPGIEASSQAGAIVLTGSPYEREVLMRAKIRRAESIIMLSGSDRDNVGLAYRVYEILKPKGAHESLPAKAEYPFAEIRPDQVGCILGVGEPRLVEVIRQDQIYTNSADKLRLSVFCVREMVARAMLRETRVLDRPDRLGRILVIGLGAKHQMGEALITRAAKDWHVNWNDPEVRSTQQLVIDILDEDADKFVDCLTCRVNYFQRAASDGSEPSGGCILRPISWKTSQSGFQADRMRSLLLDGKHDAIFICLADEGTAARQGLEIRRLLDQQPGSENVKVIVRVLQESTGFGPMINNYQPNDGIVRPHARMNLMAVGFADRVQDILLSMNPEVEMLAQVIHQQYLQTLDNQIAAAKEAKQEAQLRILRSNEARRPWSELAEIYRESNRAQARRLCDYLEKDLPGDTKFKLRYAPLQALSPQEGLGLSDDEITHLAKMEHENWMKVQSLAGWQLDKSLEKSDPIRGLSPFLIPWGQLPSGQQQRDIDIIRRLAFTFAKADYALEIVRPVSTVQHST
ncbi:NAD-binding protein [Blastopirellula marina]|uniref:NAD-binding protein n=1 Tax=Blastopirellula marina TaxID=124 RepID=UPI0011B0CDB8|nr:NAD-binding protein [Blastopirellula marina]